MKSLSKGAVLPLIVSVLLTNCLEKGQTGGRAEGGKGGGAAALSPFSSQLFSISRDEPREIDGVASELIAAQRAAAFMLLSEQQAQDLAALERFANVVESQKPFLQCELVST